MKTLFTLLVSILSITFSTSQTDVCDCKKDLDFVVDKMKTMPSYKQQIKKEKKEKVFNKKYLELSKTLNEPISVSKCYILLNKMMNVVLDNHAKVYDNSIYLTPEEYKNKKILLGFLASDKYTNHPKTNRNLAQLTEQLKNKPFENIEGIYTYDSEQKVGIYQVSDTEYEVVVLETEKKVWEPGQIVMYLENVENNRYNIARFKEIGRGMLYGKGILNENGRLWDLRKDVSLKDFSQANYTDKNWVFEEINDTTQYLYMGSFSNRKENVKAFKEFYSKMKTELTAPNVIIDLRTNTGGNSKYSDPFIKLLKKINANVFVITNSFTASNGEQFTVKLKEQLKNVTHVGQSTMGAIAYGTNYGRTYQTPSGNFKILPTDMDFHNKFFEYEIKGVTPDVVLDFSSDWIEQTIKLMNLKL